MFRILYVFPHPDDESYGPAGAIDKSIEEGNEVHLLTLTKGGATKQRHRFNLSIKEMGEVRYREMLNVKESLNLTSMKVHDLTDSGLKEMDPRDIEKIIHDHVLKINPDILITYPVHGISGYPDHLITHAAVKRVFMELKDKNNNLRRLAFFGLTEDDNKKNEKFDFKTIKGEETDCVVELSTENVKAAHNALDCYVTYKVPIEGSHIKEMVTKSLSFEFFQESFKPPVASLTDRLIKKY
ncbi:MAG: PIG-L family deacetylase [Calditrichaeota bacterium]|nr:MAG: PIG-L family deacetylase [Calditrichota bacterium]MBL1207511.1 PIG-L family deacetylase [Calditrichota bacterium]NOG47343.1 PIG-L family deacetylase [Calditrichota bacterium]